MSVFKRWNLALLISGAMFGITQGAVAQDKPLYVAEPGQYGWRACPSMWR